MDNSYKKIADHYSKCFQKHGDTPQGLDWSNQEDMNKRYEVMYGLIKNDPKSSYNNYINNWEDLLLDFGCGYGGFYHWLIYYQKLFKYTGIDINENLVNKAKEKYHPGLFDVFDINKKEDWENFNKIFKNFDYIMCNGTFTVKHTLTQKQMDKFFSSTLEKLWTKCNKGIAFNLMSKNVEWERDDLFHVAMDPLFNYLSKKLSRNVVFRNDYGLYEYTCYVYKD